MDKTEKSKKKQAGIVLIAGFLLFGVWNLFWFSPVYPLWQKLNGRLPENIYFPVEEFLALNGHHNSIYALGGSLIIAIGTIAWARIFPRIAKSKTDLQILSFFDFSELCQLRSLPKVGGNRPIFVFPQTECLSKGTNSLENL